MDFQVCQPQKKTGYCATLSGPIKKKYSISMCIESIDEVTADR